MYTQPWSLGEVKLISVRDVERPRQWEEADKLTDMTDWLTTC